MGRPKPMRDVARVLVVERQLVLAVHDWRRPDKISLPGGGVERGERPRDAAARELWEETGLRAVDIAYLTSVEDQRRHQFTTVFFATAQGHLASSHEGRACWVSPGALLRGRYGDFHAAVFEEAFG